MFNFGLFRLLRLRLPSISNFIHGHTESVGVSGRSNPNSPSLASPSMVRPVTRRPVTIKSTKLARSISLPGHQDGNFDPLRTTVLQVLEYLQFCAEHLKLAVSTVRSRLYCFVSPRPSFGTIISACLGQVISKRQRHPSWNFCWNLFSSPSGVILLS